jgi:hypothetical protein
MREREAIAIPTMISGSKSCGFIPMREVSRSLLLHGCPDPVSAGALVMAGLDPAIRA